jgi:formamidopyrimidine-DNA glycosylase
VPELPDIVVYIEALEVRIVGETLEKIRLSSPFLLRSVAPPVQVAQNRKVTHLRRMGKRIVVGLEGELFLVFHLMIAGRFQWKDFAAGQPRPKVTGKRGLAAFDFTSGTLLLTEAGSKKRASLHLVSGETNLAMLDPGGVEVLDEAMDSFREALRRENHTLKRALTDPRLFSGIGNAYSDEILHRARLSPVKLTRRLSDEEIERLYQAARETLEEWAERLRGEAGGGFPKKVTAFRPAMAVHGRYKKPCPDCGSPVQRIVYAENETNYCAKCQTGGKLLADRALSRLLRSDWPRTLEELEDRRSSDPPAPALSPKDI